MSIAIFGFQDKLEILLPEDTQIFCDSTEYLYTSLNDFLLRGLDRTILHFQGHLKTVNLIQRDIKDKINTSMDNKYLLQMLDLVESLIYYYNGISANGSVLEKLSHNTQRLAYTSDQTALLSDVQVDNSQCCKQAEILSGILAGLMDARSSIVNNNVNNLLRKLTVFNSIFLPLNLLASMGGMSEFTQFTKSTDWRVSYLLFTIFLCITGFITYRIIEQKKSIFNFKKKRKTLPVPSSPASAGKS